MNQTGKQGAASSLYSRIAQPYLGLLRHRGSALRQEELDASHGTILYLEDITVSFDGFRALDALTLYVDAGELRCIIGPNGAGKTTMMDVITGKTRPDSGDVFFQEGVYDLSKLPEPVRRMHDLIVEACSSGDIEKLRPLVGKGDQMTQLSLGDIDGDPITFLKGLSGDSEGQEILAIMEEVLNAGYVHIDIGTPQELYVWPYFFALPLDKLNAKQRVELFKIVTAGDYDDMKQFGAYIFYRVGITPSGQWLFFVAGD